MADGALARRAGLRIIYNGEEVTQPFDDYITSVSYTDPDCGESDSINLDFHDIGREWLGSWYPELGDSIEAGVVLTNWMKEDSGQTETSFGTFTLDDFSFSGGSGGITGTFSAVSTPIKKAWKSTQRTKTWKKITIYQLGKRIAKRYKLQYVYQAKKIKIKSMEQSQQPDSEFLKQVCDDYGLGMKVYRDRLVIYSKLWYEIRGVVATYSRHGMISWSYNDTLGGRYTGGKMSYTNPNTQKTYKVKVGNSKRLLNISDQAGSASDAKKKIRAKVNAENEKVTTMSMTIPANPSLYPACNIRIRGMGKMSGKYSVTKITHNISGSGYTMDVELRRIQLRL